ncbi:hypothetical protein [Microbacterium sp.]|uniref:hypothetical protein n=1 Tax=Microbacterium sp. TaxID=51671 RepID=UPI003A874E8E
MRKWVIRFASLYVFNAVVLLVIGWLTPARVGFAVFIAALVFTLIEMFLTPLIRKMFAGFAHTDRPRSRVGEWFVQLLVALGVAACVWVLTLWLTPVRAGGWFWAYILPPIIIAIGWLVYAAVSDKIEAGAGSLYDRADAGLRGGSEQPAAPESPAAREGRAELSDGLTAEQRRMLDELGS